MYIPWSVYSKRAKIFFLECRYILFEILLASLYKPDQ